MVGWLEIEVRLRAVRCSYPDNNLSLSPRVLFFYFLLIPRSPCLSWYMLDQSKRIAPSSSSHRQVDPRFALSFIGETQTVSRGNSTPHTLGYLLLPRLYIHKQQILEIPHTHNPHHVNKRLRLQTLQVGCFRVGALAVSPVTISTPTESTCHSL